MTSREASSTITYSPSLLQPPSAHLLFVSGHVALGPAGEALFPGDMRAQSAHVFRQIEAELGRHGSKLQHVVKLTAFLTDMSRYSDYSTVRGEFFSPPYPTSSAVEVSALVQDGLLVEIEAIASVPADRNIDESAGSLTDVGPLK